MRCAVFAFVAFAALSSYVSAECANACSGHGVCSSSDQCDCFPNYKAADCSERVCPYGFAWVDSPRGDLDHDGVVGTSRVPAYSSYDTVSYEYEQYPTDSTGGKSAGTNEGHYYTECSNKGLCDRTSGECVCYDGYTGSSCQRTTCPNDCSGHGVCRTVEEVVAGGLNYRKIDNAGGDTFWEGSRGTQQYRLWDMDMAQTCVCDPGYAGADCSRRLCPRGDDPLTHRPADCGGNTCVVETQRIAFTVAATSGSFVYLQFIDWTGKVWNTVPFLVSNVATVCGGITPDNTGGSGLATTIENALQGIPNGVLEDVAVTCTSFSCDVTFTAKPGNVEMLVLQQSDEFEARMGGCAGTLTATITEVTRGNEEESSCSNRGVCDYDTGICKCFKGYTLDDCSQQNAIAA